MTYSVEHRHSRSKKLTIGAPGFYFYSESLLFFCEIWAVFGRSFYDIRLKTDEIIQKQRKFARLRSLFREKPSEKISVSNTLIPP